MGQYWYPVNLDKREFIHPHKLGSGLKLWEQVANSPGVGAALVILTAAMPARRGGGDLHILEANEKIIGRWAGDRIAIVGDYAENSDLPGGKEGDVPASAIFGSCISKEDEDDPDIDVQDRFRDISDLVCRQIEHELEGTFVGDGWRSFRFDTEDAA